MDTNEFDFLSDTMETTATRYVTFVGCSLHRFDLAITSTSRFYGKKLVTDLQSGLTAIVGQDDLKEEGYLESFYRLSVEEGGELRSFLSLVIGEPTNPL